MFSPKVKVFKQKKPRDLRVPWRYVCRHGWTQHSVVDASDLDTLLGSLKYHLQEEHDV